MRLSVTGELYKAFPTEQKTESFSAREFILRTLGDYPQLVKFQLVQDRCSLLDNYQPGDEIEVHFDLRGREWVNPEGEARYFTNLNAWRIDIVNATEAQPPPPAAPEPEPEPAGSPEGGESDDDLPF